MSIHINVGGVWKDLTGSNGPSINVGGTWKTPDSVHINVGGVWKEVWTSGAVVTLSGETISDFSFGVQAYAGVYFYSSGTDQGKVKKRVRNTYTVIDATTDWIIPNSGSDGQYDIYASKTGGQVLGSSLNTWLNDFTNGYGWYVTDNTASFGGVDATVTVQIRYMGGTALDSGAYFLSADREDF